MNHLPSQVGFPGTQTLRWSAVGQMINQGMFLVSTLKKEKEGDYGR